MGFWKAAFGIAKQMDKQRFKQIEKNEKLKEKQEKKEYFNELFLSYWDEHIVLIKEALAIIEEGTEKREFYASIEDYDGLIKYHEEVATRMEQIYEEAKLISQIHELPPASKRYLQEFKDNFLKALECYVISEKLVRDGLYVSLQGNDASQFTDEAVIAREKFAVYQSTFEPILLKAQQAIYNS